MSENRKKNSPPQASSRSIANEPSRKGIARPAAPASLHEQDVIQRVAIEENRFNVAGEDHDESEEAGRRHEERAFSIEKSKGGYWTEEQLKVTMQAGDGSTGPVDADPLILRWFHAVYFLSDFIEGLRRNYRDLYSTADWKLEDLKAKANLVSRTARNLIDMYLSLHTKTNEELPLINAQNDMSTIEQVKAQVAEVENIRMAEESIRGKGRLLGEALNAANDPSQDRQVTKANFHITDEILALIDNVNKLKAIGKYQTDHRQLGQTRSYYMMSAAQQYYAFPGVWKIGAQHEQDIRQQYGTQIAFNLISRAEFNTLFTEWKQGMSFEELRAINYQAKGK
jgi:hypothetical protein